MRFKIMLSVNLLLKNGCESTFKTIFDTYHKVLYSYVIQKTSSSYLSEEVVQITFVKLWRYRKSIDENLSISLQLFRIAKTVLIDLLRKEQNSDKYFENIRFSEEKNKHNIVYQYIDLKETQQKLERLMNMMPPVRKKVFHLSRIESLSYKEIAEKLSITPKTVENHINLALKYLRPYFSIFVFTSLFTSLYSFITKWIKF